MGGLKNSDLEIFDDERSLRSRVRRTVLLYLYKISKAGKKVTAYEIAQGTGICYPNVRGALSGLAGRFSRVLSLACRGMVIEEKASSGSSVYSLTEKGQFIANLKLNEGKLPEIDV